MMHIEQISNTLDQNQKANISSANTILLRFSGKLEDSLDNLTQTNQEKLLKILKYFNNISELLEEALHSPTNQDKLFETANRSLSSLLERYSDQSSGSKFRKNMFDGLTKIHSTLNGIEITSTQKTETSKDNSGILKLDKSDRVNHKKGDGVKITTETNNANFKIPKTLKSDQILKNSPVYELISNKNSTLLLLILELFNVFDKSDCKFHEPNKEFSLLKGYPICIFNACIGNFLSEKKFIELNPKFKNLNIQVWPDINNPNSILLEPTSYTLLKPLITARLVEKFSAVPNKDQLISLGFSASANKSTLYFYSLTNKGREILKSGDIPQTIGLENLTIEKLLK